MSIDVHDSVICNDAKRSTSPFGTVVPKLFRLKNHILQTYTDISFSSWLSLRKIHRPTGNCIIPGLILSFKEGLCGPVSCCVDDPGLPYLGPWPGVLAWSPWLGHSCMEDLFWLTQPESLVLRGYEYLDEKSTNLNTQTGKACCTLFGIVTNDIRHEHQDTTKTL